MKKSFLSLQVTCKLEYTLEPADEYETYFDLQDFLSDLNENPEMIELLEDGECVSTCKHDLTPNENNLIEITKSGTVSEIPFCLSLDDLKSVSDTLSLYDQTKRSLEIGVEFTKPETIGDRKTFSYKTTNSGFIGHAYQSLELFDDEQIPSSLDVAILSLVSYNNYNRLNDRQSSFNEVLLPQSEPVILSQEINNHSNYEPSTIRASSGNLIDEQLNLEDINLQVSNIHSDSSVFASNISAELFKEPLMFQSLAKNSSIGDSDLVHDTIPSPVTSHLSAILDVNTCPNTKPAAMAESSANTSGSDKNPSDELPPWGLEVIGDLANYLRKKGAFPSIRYHPVEHTDVNNRPVFSDTVTFQIGSCEYKFPEFLGSSRFMKKSDAKKNVAYQACKALNVYGYGNKEDETESDDVPNLMGASPDQNESELSSQSLNDDENLQSLGVVDPQNVDLGYEVLPSNPNDSGLPPEGSNVVGKLNEHLQSLHALHTLKWAKEVGLEYFSVALSFKINQTEYSYRSSKEFFNKKDAKRSAFYNACKDLGLYKS